MQARHSTLSSQFPAKPNRAHTLQGSERISHAVTERHAEAKMDPAGQ
jgi:hypothetical protein